MPSGSFVMSTASNGGFVGGGCGGFLGLLRKERRAEGEEENGEDVVHGA
jgi:hypothetical protein